MQSYCNLINAKDREREKERRGGHFSYYRRGGGNSGADLEGLGQVPVRVVGLPTQFLAQSISPPPPFEVIRFTKKL